MVYSKPLGGKSRIVKLVREMKKKNGSFTWAVLYIENFTSKNWKFSDKNSDIFFIFLLKT